MMIWEFTLSSYVFFFIKINVVTFASCIIYEQNKTNSMALVCKRTMPTERLQLVGEVSANVCG
jgi:hypothetical protein